MGRDCQAVEVSGDSLPENPGEWCWRTLDTKGRGVLCVLPNGENAFLDSRWTISGDPANITAQPSINLHSQANPDHNWHGWLTNGRFTEC